jgi:hypothetical protein
MGDYQLRAQDEAGNDTGELRYFEKCEEALEKFIEGGFWKMSWTMANGKRVRLLRVDERNIQITYPGEECMTYKDLGEAGLKAQVRDEEGIIGEQG